MLSIPTFYLLTISVLCRHCELEGLGKSAHGKCCSFWSQFYSRLQEDDIKLDSLTLKQIRYSEEMQEELYGSLTMITNVTIVNNEMNRKQWAKFAVTINRSDKRLRCLGDL